MPCVASARLSSAPVALPWLPGCTNTGSLDDGAETGALLLAAGLNRGQRWS